MRLRERNDYQVRHFHDESTLLPVLAPVQELVLVVDQLVHLQPEHPPHFLVHRATYEFLAAPALCRLLGRDVGGRCGIRGADLRLDERLA